MSGWISYEEMGQSPKWQHRSIAPMEEQHKAKEAMLI